MFGTSLYSDFGEGASKSELLSRVNVGTMRLCLYIVFGTCLHSCFGEGASESELLSRINVGIMRLLKYALHLF